jgi:transposase
MPGDSTRRYPLELKQRAMRMVPEIASEHESEWAAMGRVAELLGLGTAETVRGQP